MKILKDEGIFAFICSNKFANVKYGEKLRELILNNEMKIYYDFSGIKVFKEATVDTCVIQIKKSFNKKNEIFVNNDYYLLQNRLSKEVWSFNNPIILDLKEKILNKSKLLENFNITIKRGFTTGFNKAYIINKETHNNLIKSDIKNKEIIKPILKGTDIEKFKITFNDTYIIIIKHGYGKTLKEDYPTIYEHLIQFETNLKSRGQVKNGQHHWLDLDNAVTQEFLNYFNQEIIIWQRVCKEPNFALNVDNYHILDSMAFLTTDDTDFLYFLLAILNSNLIKWYLKLIGHKYGKTGFLVSNQYVKKLPIPIITSKEKQELINLSKKIIKYSKETSDNKTSLNSLYTELNSKIYEIYNLNNYEINLIKDSL